MSGLSLVLLPAGADGPFRPHGDDGIGLQGLGHVTGKLLMLISVQAY